MKLKFPAPPHLEAVMLPEAAHDAVETVARKLTCGLYYLHEKKVFPKGGLILFHWFTSAQEFEYGHIPALTALANIKSERLPLVRNGRDLADQFDYQYSADDSREIFLLRAVFCDSFGFVTTFTRDPAKLAGLTAKLANMEQPTFKSI